MTRAKQCRSTVLCACLALALMVPASAPARDAAVEEYILTLPGANKKDVGGTSAAAARAGRAGPIGVVGEQDDGFNRLAAVGTALSTPGGIAVVLALAGGVALAAARRRGAG